MGGKTGTTTATTKIPKEIMERYTAVNKLAEQTAQTPFQQYSGEFVAPLTGTQQAGIGQTIGASQAAQPYFRTATQNLLGAQAAAQPQLAQAGETLGLAQQAGQGYADVARQLYGQAGLAASPYYQAATGLTAAGARSVDPSQLNVGQYMNPYIKAVADPTYQALMQQQSQEMQGQLGNAIRSGAFGGDRAGIAAANLARQQQLGMSQAMAPIYQQGYQQALQTAQQQQGLGLSAEQANRAAQAAAGQQFAGLGQALYGQNLGTGQALANLGQQQFGQGATTAQQQAALAQQLYGMGSGTAQQLAALGTGAQAAGLQGAQATLGAGTLEQQTKQAQDTAEYQQFLQQRGYPFQVAQFLANIAMGTGALSGSTTQTTQPIPFFSDRRLKDDVKEIGKTHDGLPIYSFKYKGDDATQIGLMAQDVEKKHPEAVGLAGGYKTVDYAKATEDSARPEHHADGGIVPSSMGGVVNEPGSFNRGGYAVGGDVIDPNDLSALLQQQQSFFGPFGQGGIYGDSQHKTPFSGAAGIVPQGRLHVPRLQAPSAASGQMKGLGSQALDAFDTISQTKDRFDSAKKMFEGPPKKDGTPPPTPTSTTNKPLENPNVAADSGKAFSDIKADPSMIDKAKEFFGFGKSYGGSVGGIYPDHFAAGGIIDPYKQDPSASGVPEDVLEKGSETANKLMKPDAASAITRGPGNDAMDAAKAAATAAQAASAIMSMFAASDRRIKDNVEPIGKTFDGQMLYRYDLGGGGKKIGLMAQEVLEKHPHAVAKKNGILMVDYKKATDKAAEHYYSGGVVPRDGFAEGGDPEYKIQPLDYEHMPEHRQALIKGIYGPESGERYDIMQGGKETFDTSKSHPGRVGLGGESTAAGAGQFIKKTWDDVTGGAPMTKPYQDAATWALANRDFKSRTGEDLDTVLQKEGFSSRVKDVLSPTWTALGGVKGKEQPAQAVLSSQPPSGEGKEAGFGQNLQNWVSQNYGWLAPIGAGLKGMAQSKSPFLGAALLEGVGSGLSALPDVAKTQQDIATSKAGATTALSGIPMDALIGEIDPVTGKVTYRIRPDYFGGSLAKKGEKPTPLQEQQQKTIEAGKAAVGSPTPIVAQVSQGQYNYDAQPTSRVDEAFAARGYTGDPNDAFRIPAYLTPEERKTAETDRELQNNRKLEAANTPQMRQETNMLSDAVLGIGPDGITGQGPAQSGRSRLVNLYNWAVRFGGIPGGQIGEDSEITNQQIINKLSASAGTRVAGERGFHAGYLAQAINEAQPSGELTAEASAKILASTYINMQIAEDFSKYAANYVKRYGTTLDLDKNFRQDMGQHYDKAKTAMTEALTPRMMQDGSYQSGFTWLRKNPQKAMEFDKMYGVPGLSRMILGG